MGVRQITPTEVCCLLLKRPMKGAFEPLKKAYVLYTRVLGQVGHGVNFRILDEILDPATKKAVA